MLDPFIKEVSCENKGLYDRALRYENGLIPFTDLTKPFKPLKDILLLSLNYPQGLSLSYFAQGSAKRSRSRRVFSAPRGTLG